MKSTNFRARSIGFLVGAAGFLVLFNSQAAGQMRTDAPGFVMGLWHGHSTVGEAAAVFWCADGNSTSEIEPIATRSRHRITAESEAPRVTKKIRGALEGEDLEIVEVEGGTTQIQHNTDFNWSGDKQLWWLDARPGQRLVIEFPFDKEGDYTLYAGLTKARNYGIVQIKINGQVLQETLDFYNPHVVATELYLGTCRLEKGANRLEVAVTGANPNAEKRYMFGLDYLKAITPSAYFQQ